jgi:peptidyl-dipeptidase A
MRRSFSGEDGGPVSSAAPHRLVSSLEDRFSRLEIAFHEAYWSSQVEATPANDHRRARLELELRSAKGDRKSLDDVQEALGQPLQDPMLRRQLEVLRLSLVANQMPESERARLVEIASSVESDFASFRPEVEGRAMGDNDIEEVLRTSDDTGLRRRVWEASKEIGAVVAERVRELARVRNQAARDQGFADYYRMALDLQELPERWLFGVLDDLDALTRAPFERWKTDLDGALARRFGTDDLAPWHYADPFFQSLPPDGRITLDDVLGDASAPELARRTFAGWAMDLSGVMAKSDLYPRAQKCQHAFCLDVDRSGDDVRILANVVAGERWVEIMLHESGHAAYDVEISAELPYLLRRAAHTFVTEAAAILSGRLARDPAWLRDVAGVEGGEVAALAGELRRATTTQSLLFTRWGLVMAHFERELYADPEADLDTRWWELVERFQRVGPPDGRPAPDWAAKIHVAVAPVYYHNYLLGEILASQLRTTCEQAAGGFVGVPEAGRLLSERIFRHGALMRWDALVEQATGSPLRARDFAGALG